MLTQDEINTKLLMDIVYGKTGKISRVTKIIV